MNIGLLGEGSVQAVLSSHSCTNLPPGEEREGSEGTTLRPVKQAYFLKFRDYTNVPAAMSRECVLTYPGVCKFTLYEDSRWRLAEDIRDGVPAAILGRL